MIRSSEVGTSARVLRIWSFQPIFRQESLKTIRYKFAFFSVNFYNLLMKSRHMTELLISKMKEIPMPESIAAMYVYGSIVPGRLRNDSDIDIAILPSFETNDFEKLQLISKVAAIITSALKTIGTDREVSVLDMRGRYVSLQLLYKIITEGTLIYDSDSTQRIDFENAIKRDYFDFEPYLLGLRKRKYGDLYQKA